MKSNILLPPDKATLSNDWILMNPWIRNEVPIDKVIQGFCFSTPFAACRNHLKVLFNSVCTGIDRTFIDRKKGLLCASPPPWPAVERHSELRGTKQEAILPHLYSIDCFGLLPSQWRVDKLLRQPLIEYRRYATWLRPDCRTAKPSPKAITNSERRVKIQHFAEFNLIF